MDRLVQNLQIARLEPRLVRIILTRYGDSHVKLPAVVLRKIHRRVMEHPEAEVLDVLYVARDAAALLDQSEPHLLPRVGDVPIVMAVGSDARIDAGLMRESSASRERHHRVRGGRVEGVADHDAGLRPFVGVAVRGGGGEALGEEGHGDVAGLGKVEVVETVVRSPDVGSRAVDVPADGGLGGVAGDADRSDVHGVLAGGEGG
mmetsp:Transcript_33054/g.79968  ORF Transcript_33054/g.79968 Transcript_33054/m.79968 type:complete len:203 (-) Transcript_33054:166-774(-)